MYRQLSLKSYTSYDLEGGNRDAQFDVDSLIIRRADPDDCEQIGNLIELGKDDIYDRVYSKPKILGLIESAFLAISVLDREGNVVAFAAFEDFPCGMRGMSDDKHFNYWEKWIKQAYQVEDFTALNTLWIAYFVAGGVVPQKQQRYAFKKVLQTVYTSLPDLIGVLFLARGDADEDDVHYCLDPLSIYFEEVPCKHEDSLQDSKVVPKSSKIYFSSRVLLLPFIEIRQAKQEDHDDLADVFNNQSETVTEAYGEYFLAELIANQNENNKALVAQVKDKAVGLMAVSNEIDSSLLHQCFELEQYDNLLKPEVMDAVKKRREYLSWEAEVTSEKKRIEFLKQMKKETMRCNIISQRIMLQEHLIRKSEQILADIEAKVTNEEELQKLNEKEVRKMMIDWLDEFKLLQPSDFLRDHPTNDAELICLIQEKEEFMLSTLEFFGLPKNYMEGAGHFPWWGKEKKDDKLALARKRAATKGGKAKVKNAALEKAKKKRNIDKKVEEVKPTYFDIAVFQQCFKRFVACDGRVRSVARQMLLRDLNRTMKVFLDEHKEMSYKKCVDVFELARLLATEGFDQDPVLNENMASILLCFGEIEHDIQYGERIPPETEDERKLRFIAEVKAKELEDAIKEAQATGGNISDIDIKVPVIEPKKPILMLLRLISITDLKFCLQTMFEYDKVLFEMNEQSFDIADEKRLIAILTQKLRKKFYEEEKDYVMPQEPSRTYSNNPEIQKIVETVDDMSSIPEVPDSFKNSFAITLFCMEAAFDSRSIDFLKYAFDAFPDRDYLVITQPTSVVEQQLLQKFSQAVKKTNNTFQHVLYLMHRDFLYAQDLVVERIDGDDLLECKDLIISLDEYTDFYAALYEASINPNCTNYAFVAKVMGVIIATFVVSKDVNLDYYTSHFHVQDQILLSEQDRKNHTRLLYTCVNPIFERMTRTMLKEVLRMTAKTCMYFEVKTDTIIPPIFHDLVHIRSRRFPHFLDRKWDHERFESEESRRKKDENSKNRIDGFSRDPLDEVEAPFALCFTTRRMLSEPKIVKNSRIVVVGASDTSISFVEALLSTSYLHFTSIVLVAPGGLPHHHYFDKTENLRSYSTSYTNQELKRLMLESRVRVINARMTDIDRSDKNIILHDDTVIPYDTLILGMGIQDKTLNSLGYVSRGIANPGEMMRADQILSIDDPHLYQHLRLNGSLINMLTDKKRVKHCVIYGRSLSTYCCIQGLINRGVRAEQITLAIPSNTCHVQANYDEPEIMQQDLPYIYPEAFEDLEIEEKIQLRLQKMGVKIIKPVKLIEIEQDKEEGLQLVVFKRLDVPDEETDEDEIEGLEEKSEGQGSNMGSGGNGTAEDASQNDEEAAQEADLVKQKKKRKKNEIEIECRLLITSGHRDVDQDVFLSIHNNGLVYNGRLIVDKSFQTTDPSIFAAGSLCEFSGRYKSISQGRPLRLDRYNGREMGARLASSIFDIYNPQFGEQEEENLPQFHMPNGQGGMLPGEILYYHVQTTNPLIQKQGAQETKNRKSLRCDNIDAETGKGHFIRFDFNNIGIIDAVTYMGTEEVVLQSLVSFVGLHENYLNQLTSKYEHGIIPNVTEFLSENWAIALYHEWFGDFCIRLRDSVRAMESVQMIIHNAFEEAQGGHGISRDKIKHLQTNVDATTIRMIQEETLEFIRTNMNHLPMYYIPNKEFD